MGGRATALRGRPGAAVPRSDARQQRAARSRLPVRTAGRLGQARGRGDRTPPAEPDVLGVSGGGAGGAGRADRRAARGPVARPGAGTGRGHGAGVQLCGRPRGARPPAGPHRAQPTAVTVPHPPPPLSGAASLGGRCPCGRAVRVRRGRRLRCPDLPLPRPQRRGLPAHRRAAVRRDRRPGRGRPGADRTDCRR